MNTRTVVSVDLDWLNGDDHPIDRLRELMKHIPRNIPSVITIEHHEFLPDLRRWIKSGRVLTPFNILQIDEHHDFYVNRPPYHPEGTETSCGNWGYRMPLAWYKRFTWVHNSRGEFCDWTDAEKWLRKHSIPFSVRDRHRMSELRSKIVAAVFCVSPDYLDHVMFDYISDAVEIVARHFRMKKAPQLIRSNRDVSSISSWRIAPRPLKVAS